MTYASVLCVALLLGGGEAFTVPSRTTSRPGVAARPVRTRLASYLDNLKDGPSLDVAEPEAEVAAHLRRRERRRGLARHHLDRRVDNLVGVRPYRTLERVHCTHHPFGWRECAIRVLVDRLARCGFKSPSGCP